MARRHLKLLDPFGPFVVLGDIGGRIFLYYARCEEKLQSRRALGRLVEARNVDWLDYGTQMTQIFYHQSRESLHRWRASLKSILPLLLDEKQLSAVLRGSFTIWRPLKISRLHITCTTGRRPLIVLRGTWMRSKSNYHQFLMLRHMWRSWCHLWVIVPNISRLLISKWRGQ